ncbi:hypothetical protein JM16_000669 [Phytophthora kernoviae]|uniref:Uncharacterized protein n=1 Tax=Phytophthora kernoviae TaxID=325452 RepID=A0A8T0M9P8_9STRA|nr:hypothetical protein JM16_000669 [Phytophthora kernoviae]
MDQDLSYSYSSKPRPVQTNRSKARDGGVYVFDLNCLGLPCGDLDVSVWLNSKPTPPNIMHDPRIPRGSVFAPIEESDGLFNFDVEVMPLLNVLVNKTLAQALLEVKEEQEIRLLHCQNEALKSDKSDAQQEERALEDKAKEAQRRKELIKKKKAEDLQQDRVMREKLLAWQLARPLASQAINQATSTLYKKGVFYDPILRDLTLWMQRDIYEAADANIRLRYLSSQLLDESKIEAWIVGHLGGPVDIPVEGFLSLLQLTKTI